MKTFTTLLASAAVALGLGIGGVARASDGHHGGHHGGGHHGGGHHSGHHDGGHYSHHYGSHHSGHYGHLGLGLLGYTAYRSYTAPYYYDYGYSRPYYRGRVAYSRAAESLGGEVQIELARLGYYRGPIDGVIGSGTRRALRDFQAEAGLPITGRIDRATVEELGIG